MVCQYGHRVPAETSYSTYLVSTTVLQCMIVDAASDQLLAVFFTCHHMYDHQVLAYYGYVNLNWHTVTTAFLWGLDADRDG